MKRKYWIAVYTLILLALGSAYTLLSRENTVGGDRDDHGCIASAGYSWCAPRSACERSFETFCASATPKTATFKCSASKKILAIFYPADDKYVDLKLSDGRNMSVPHAISGSGARYANSDESFVFWNKGDTAFITEGTSTTYKDCVL